MTELHLAPTARLARQLVQDYTAARRAEGNAAWLTPEVFTVPAWLRRLRDRYHLDAIGAETELPTPITTHQSLLLWQSIIEDDVLIGGLRIAQLAQDAWRTIHEFDLSRPADWPIPLLSEDTSRFAQWGPYLPDRMRAPGTMGRMDVQRRSARPHSTG